MQLNRSNLTELQKQLRVVFNEGFQAASPTWRKLATVIDSSKGVDEYIWMCAMAGMKKLADEPVINNVSHKRMQLEVCEWENTFGIKRTDIERNCMNIYGPLVRNMGAIAAQHPDELLGDLFVKLFSTEEKAYDGLPFLDMGDSRGFSNLDTFELSAGSLACAIANCKARKNEKGRLMGFSGRPQLIVSAKYEQLARQILEASEIDGSSNTQRNSAELCVLPILDCVGLEKAWFVICGSGAANIFNPFVFQEEKRPGPVMQLDANDSYVILKGEMLYQIYGRYEMHTGFPQGIFASDGSTAPLPFP